MKNKLSFFGTERGFRDGLGDLGGGETVMGNSWEEKGNVWCLIIAFKRAKEKLVQDSELGVGT
jgi:hypothetical protein